jgi:hypothetical protein
MRTLPLLALALCAAGCPSEVALNCPPSTASLGQFTLAFKPIHPDAGECIQVTTDAGVQVSSTLTTDDAGSTGLFCYAGVDGGGINLTLVVPGKGALQTPLVDGGFNFTQQSDPTNGTACACPVTISETFKGTFSGFDDAGIAALSDGGLPLVSSVSGTLNDTLTQVTAGDAGCLCVTPCTVTYGIDGTRF